MQIRLVNLKEDYDVLKTWFLERNWGPGAPLKEHLPDTGWLVSSDDGEWLSAGWVYITNSPIKIIEWTVTNPKAKPLTRLKGLNFLIKWIKQAFAGKPTVFMQFIPDKKLERYYTSHLGFTKTEDAAILIAHGK